MSQPLVYVDTSHVREGAVDQLKRAIEELAEFVEENEPELLSYSVYFSDDGSEMTVVHVHRDRASLDFHLEVAGPRFPGFVDLVTLLTIDLYGAPSDTLLEQMRRKADLLGGARLAVHGSLAGFVRAER